MVVTGTPKSGTSDSVLTPLDQWAAESDVVLAVNANYFSRVNRKGDELPMSDIIGLSVSNGVVVSGARSFNGRADPALVFRADQTADIGYLDEASAPMEAVAGVGASPSDAVPGTLLVADGTNLGTSARVDPLVRHPRTAAGVSADGRTLWLVAIDGRQPDWSVGMTLPELADLMIELGADDAINLDGGGSTSFWYRPDGKSPPLVNRPSDGAFRPVANHLGVSVRSINNVLSTAASDSWRD